MKRNPLKYLLAFSLPIIMVAGLLLSVHAKASSISELFVTTSPMEVVTPPYEERLFKSTISHLPKPGETFDITYSLGDYDPAINGIVLFEIRLYFDPENVEYIDSECIYLDNSIYSINNISLHQTRLDVHHIFMCSRKKVLPKGIDEFAKITLKVKETVVPGTLLEFPVTEYLVQYTDGQQANLAYPTKYLLGDVNFDKEINIRDIISIRNHIFGTAGLIGDLRWPADINRSDSIDIYDIMAIRNHIFGTSVIKQPPTTPYTPQDTDYFYRPCFCVSN